MVTLDTVLNNGVTVRDLYASYLRDRRRALAGKDLSASRRITEATAVAKVQATRNLLALLGVADADLDAVSDAVRKEG
jgi:hypothetical protein